MHVIGTGRGIGFGADHFRTGGLVDPSDRGQGDSTGLQTLSGEFLEFSKWSRRHPAEYRIMHSGTRQARLLDFSRRFNEAASRYHELSFIPDIDEEERIYML